MHFNIIVISIHFSSTIFMPIFTVRESIHERREIAFSRTEMDAVFEMATSSSNSVGVAISRRRYSQQEMHMLLV